MPLEETKKALIDAYSIASKKLREYDEEITKEGDGRDKHTAYKALEEAQKALCDGLSVVNADPEFWSAMADQLRDAGSKHAELREALKDLNAVVAREGLVLKKLGMCGADVSQLLGEFAITLRVFRATPSGDTLMLVRGKLAFVQAAVCDLKKSQLQESADSWGRAWRSLRIGLKAVSGLLLIAGDLLAEEIPILKLTSVMCGNEVLTSIGDI